MPIANIDVDLDYWVSDAGAGPGGGINTTIGDFGSNKYRSVYRFPLSSIDPVAINDVDWSFSVNGSDGTGLLDVYGYGVGSGVDPNTGTAAARYAAAVAGTKYVTGAAGLTDGAKQLDLGASANSELLALINDEDRFSIGADFSNADSSGDTPLCNIVALDNGSDYSVLIVDYSEPISEEVTGAGGIILLSTAVLAHYITRTLSGAGGISLASTAVLAYYITRTIVGSGGLVLSSTAVLAHYITRTISASGGVKLGSTAVIVIDVQEPFVNVVVNRAKAFGSTDRFSLPTGQGTNSSQRVGGARNNGS